MGVATPPPYLVTANAVESEVVDVEARQNQDALEPLHGDSEAEVIAKAHGYIARDDVSDVSLSRYNPDTGRYEFVKDLKQVARERRQRVQEFLDGEA